MKKMFALMMLVGLAAGIMVGCGDTGTGVTTIAALDTKYDATVQAATDYSLIGTTVGGVTYYYNFKTAKYYRDVNNDGLHDAGDTVVTEADMAVAFGMFPVADVDQVYVYSSHKKTVYLVDRKAMTATPCYDMDDKTIDIPVIPTGVAGALTFPLAPRVEGLGYSGYFLTNIVKAADGTITETVVKYNTTTKAYDAVAGWGK